MLPSPLNTYVLYPPDTDIVGDPVVARAARKESAYRSMTTPDPPDPLVAYEPPAEAPPPPPRFVAPLPPVD